MIWLIFIGAIFICVSSIFHPPLRMLAKCILATAAVIAIGLAGLIAIAAHH